MADRPSAHGQPAITAIAGAASAAAMPPSGTPVCWNENRKLRRSAGRVAHEESGRRGRDETVPQAHHDEPSDEQESSTAAP